MQVQTITIPPPVWATRLYAGSGWSCMFAKNGKSLSGTVMTGLKNRANYNQCAHDGAKIRIISRRLNLHDQQRDDALQMASATRISTPGTQTIRRHPVYAPKTIHNNLLQCLKKTTTTPAQVGGRAAKAATTVTEIRTVTGIETGTVMAVVIAKAAEDPVAAAIKVEAVNAAVSRSLRH